MEELSQLVARSQAGDLDAYGQIVGRFQDMAYGYAYSVLGDFHLAEDAAQEAFVCAYRSLAGLKERAKFPGWFRRIVFTSCQRLTRKAEVPTVMIDAAAGNASREPDPAALAETKEARDAILAAIKSLPEGERTATTLFYINGYSQAEIADFLEVPVTTVNNRLYASRKRLKERMMNMVADEMKSRPLAETFPGQIRLLLDLPQPLKIQGHPVRDLWKEFRECFHDFEVVELDEMHPRASFMQPGDRWRRSIFDVNPQQMLRIDLTTQLVERWLHLGKPACRWVACGRVFRNDKPDAIHLEAFHQAELFWCGPEVTAQLGEEALQRAGAVLLPEYPLTQSEPYSYVPVSDAHDWRVNWRGRCFGVAGGGIFDELWLKSVGVSPNQMRGFGFAFGLERVAQVRHNLDDIRKLWQPPYVPE